MELSDLRMKLLLLADSSFQPKFTINGFCILVADPNDLCSLGNRLAIVMDQLNQLLSLGVADHSVLLRLMILVS